MSQPYVKVTYNRSSSKTDKRKGERITIEALRYYVPIFQEADKAEELLLNKDNLTPSDRNHLETLQRLKQLAIDAVADLAAPLITREITKLIKNSHLRGRDDLYDILFYAGLDGMRRGMKKFEVEKINASSTNYLFQWIITYARKELSGLEAPFGIPPSRFQRYKKISAVRKRLTEIQGHYATNEEVFEYFRSGKADLKNYNGRLENKDKPSRDNLTMPLDLIEEQEEFETKMLSINLLDPTEDYSMDVTLSTGDNESFHESPFGVFMDTHPVTPVARVVMMSDLGVTSFNENELKILGNLTSKEYRNISTQWQNLIKDKNGPFYQFLIHNKNMNFAQFDVPTLIESINESPRIINKSSYNLIFVKKRKKGK